MSFSWLVYWYEYLVCMLQAEGNISLRKYVLGIFPMEPCANKSCIYYMVNQDFAVRAIRNVQDLSKYMHGDGLLCTKRSLQHLRGPSSLQRSKCLYSNLISTCSIVYILLLHLLLPLHIVSLLFHCHLVRFSVFLFNQKQQQAKHWR